MMKKLQKMRKDRKGFTLVELIVVLVILAILAAMLVPALLGYIDRAKEGKYEEEVHAIYTALQVIYDEAYAKGEFPTFNDFKDNHSAETGVEKELNDMIAPTQVTAVTGINADSGIPSGTNITKENCTIKSFKVTFNSQDGTTKGLTGTLKNGVVEVIINGGGAG